MTGAHCERCDRCNRAYHKWCLRNHGYWCHPHQRPPGSALQPINENEEKVCWVVGQTGVGKSTRTPLSLMELTPVDEFAGLAHIIPRKLTSYTLYNFSQLPSSDHASMVLVWNGDEWMRPESYLFVVLTTPVSFFHRIRSAANFR